MHDIKAIRENPAAYDANWARRGLEPQTPAILDADKKHRDIIKKLETMQAERNALSAKVGEVKRSGGNADDIMAQVSSMKEEMATLETQEKEFARHIELMLQKIANQLADDVPAGADETGNVKLRDFGTIKKQEGDDHVTIGEKLGLIDFETAAKLSGARFVLLRGQIARLERAIAQFMLDTHTNEHGYTEVSGPLMVNAEVLVGTGQLPKFEDDQFKTNTGHYLIPTAEVSLTNTIREAITAEEELPLRLTAFTPCFRAEAGSAGRDTRGMLRQHQFYKVEMVSITTPEGSKNEHERMTNCAETILKKLDLPYRAMMLCAGDTGFGAQKTYDLEVWLPGQKTYREISSCSNCGDFQARRMNARIRKAGDKATRFPHTLNGSGLAVGRTLIAVLENYWDGGKVAIPDVLKPYMGNQSSIG